MENPADDKPVEVSEYITWLLSSAFTSMLPNDKCGRIRVSLFIPYAFGTTCVGAFTYIVFTHDCLNRLVIGFLVNRLLTGSRVSAFTHVGISQLRESIV